MKGEIPDQFSETKNLSKTFENSLSTNLFPRHSISSLLWMELMGKEKSLNT